MNRFTLTQMTRMKRLSELIMPSYREFYPEKLITDVGLYEAVLVDAADIQVFTEFIGDDPPHIEVSRDVAALHKFLNLKDRIMLPCPECKQSQPFDLRSYFNPRKVTVTDSTPTIVKGKCNKIPVSHQIYAPVVPIPGEHHNIFDSPEVPKYRVCEDYLTDFDVAQFQEFDFDDYQYKCAIACVDGIDENLSEARRDFYCTLNSTHHGFVDFIIYEAVDRYTKPEILQKYEKLRDKDPNAEMTKEEKREADAYERLKTCLVMEKVGQSPSMADMQMFDIEKYRVVLSRDSFRDFRMALGLYASGVGCGSFVYLRRIFEGLVKEAESVASEQDGWNEEEYKKRRFNEKLDYLENFGQKLIPDTLSEVKTKIYGVLSQGVHASSDQECIQLFPVMKYAIEEILDHKITQKEREEKLKNIGSVLGNI